MQGMTGSPMAAGHTAVRQGIRLVLVCAWCRTLLRPHPLRGDEVENFGICRRCLSEQLARVRDTPLS